MEGGLSERFDAFLWKFKGSCLATGADERVLHQGWFILKRLHHSNFHGASAFAWRGRISLRRGHFKLLLSPVLAGAT